MFSVPQIELNVIQMYIRHVESVFIERNLLTDSLLYVLRVREGLRESKLHDITLDLDDLQKLKDGHRTAEYFLSQVDRPGAEPKRVLNEISNILQLVALELHAEITAIEARYPEQRAEFAREKEEYRLQWNRYIEQYEFKTKHNDYKSISNNSTHLEQRSPDAPIRREKQARQ